MTEERKEEKFNGYQPEPVSDKHTFKKYMDCN